MEHGVRHYEAAERLRWFLFFLLCAFIAYPLGKLYSIPVGWELAISSFPTTAFISNAFSLQLPWLRVRPLGGLMIYLFWIGTLFLLLKSLILAVHLVGKHRIRSILEDNMEEDSMGRLTSDTPPTGWNRIFPFDLIRYQINRGGALFIFHPFRRLRLMLNKSEELPAWEELLEKERRASEVDWEVMAGSWSPFSWILRLLPMLAFAQVLWLVHEQITPTLKGQGEIQEAVAQASVLFLPLAQALGMVIVMAMAAGLLKRLEGLYLSSVNALFYDNFLSRLPVRSNDTVILLEAFHKHFRDIQSMLGRLEKAIVSSREKKPEIHSTHKTS